MEKIVETWRWLKETLWSRLPDPVKRILRIIAPEPDLFILGLVIIVIGMSLALPIPRPVTLDDMTRSHVCMTEVYEERNGRTTHWIVKTTDGRYGVLGSYRGFEALKERLNTAGPVEWPDDGRGSATLIPRGLIADIWCYHGNGIYEVRIDGEPVVAYTPPESEELTADSMGALRLSWIGGLAFILFPVIRKI